MSEIEIGSVWFNRCDGVEAIVKSVGSNCVGFTQIINDKEYFYTHTVEEFKEYYDPKVKAEMINQPKHYNDESGVPCCDVTDFMMFNGGNCFKYLYRCGSKFDDIEDLKKAVWYAERAKQKGEFYSDGNWAYLIREITRYRDDAIYTAMIALRWCRWSDVVVAIKAEIARLESEAADD